MQKCCAFLTEKQLIYDLDKVDGLAEELEAFFASELEKHDEEAKKKRLKKAEATAARQKELLRLADEAVDRCSLDLLEPSRKRNLAVCREAAAQFIVHQLCGMKAPPGAHSNVGRRHLTLKEMAALIKGYDDTELSNFMPRVIRVAGYTGSCAAFLEKYEEGLRKQVEHKKALRRNKAAEEEPAQEEDGAEGISEQPAGRKRKTPARAPTAPKTARTAPAAATVPAAPVPTLSLLQHIMEAHRLAAAQELDATTTLLCLTLCKEICGQLGHPVSEVEADAASA